MPMPRSPHAVNAYRILARRRETLHPRVFLASQSVPGATAQHSLLGERPKNGASFDDAQHPRAASRSRAPPSRTARSIRFDSMCPCLIRDWLEAATEHLGKFSLSLSFSRQFTSNWAAFSSSHPRRSAPLDPHLNRVHRMDRVAMHGRVSLLVCHARRCTWTSLTLPSTTRWDAPLAAVRSANERTARTETCGLVSILPECA